MIKLCGTDLCWGIGNGEKPLGRQHIKLMNCTDDGVKKFVKRGGSLWLKEDESDENDVSKSTNNNAHGCDLGIPKRLFCVAADERYVSNYDEPWLPEKHLKPILPVVIRRCYTNSLSFD